LNHPQFQQGLDVARPHTLIAGDSRSSGHLVYRYDDNQQLATVPNAWYNQPYTWRIAYIHFLADEAERHASSLRKSPPFGMTAPEASSLAGRYHEQAKRIRCEATRLAAAADETRPVAASHLQLDFGAPPAAMTQYAHA
jgi:hypothetical protein